MADTPMPVGKPVAFDGDIRAVEPNAYGFFYCKISTPEYLKHPILQRRIKTVDGVRTIAGLGSWEPGWINSAEMDNAMKFIAKLLMNSLYGKFGMKLDRKDISIFIMLDKLLIS